MEDAYTVRTEGGLIRLMSEEDVGKLVRSSIQRAKSSSAKATSFTRTRNRRSASPRAEFVPSPSKIKPPSVSVLTPRRGRDPQAAQDSTGAGSEIPDDKKHDRTEIVREASRRDPSRSVQALKKENRADSASRDVRSSGERENVPTVSDTQITERANREFKSDTATKSIQKEVTEKLVNGSAEGSLESSNTKPLQKRFPTWLSYLSESEVKETDSKRSFTVDTEAEGRRNLSETEINSLVRSSIQRARQLAKSKAKRQVSPSPLGYQRTKDIKEKHDPMTSSRKMPAPSPLGTIHRKFTWSSIEESSSDDDKKLVAKRKNGGKSKKEKTNKSKQIHYKPIISPQKLSTPTPEVESKESVKTMDRGEVAPPFSATVFEDEITIASEAHGGLLATSALESSQQRELDVMTRADDCYQSHQTDPPGLQGIEQNLERNQDPPEATNDNNLENNLQDRQLILKELQKEFDDEIQEQRLEKPIGTESIVDASHKLQAESAALGSNPDLQLRNDVDSLESKVLPTKVSDSLIPMGGEFAFGSANAAEEPTETTYCEQDAVELVNATVKDDTKTFDPNQTSTNSTEAAEEVVLKTLSECTEATVNESIDSAKPLNDSAKEVMNTLLKELLFLKTRGSKKSPEVAFSGSTDVSIITRSDAISNDTTSGIDQVATRSEALASPFSETTSQKSRSSLLGASNSDLKETLTQGGEISLPSVSDNLTAIESPGDSNEECDPQISLNDSHSVVNVDSIKEQNDVTDCIEYDPSSISKIEFLNDSPIESTHDWPEKEMEGKAEDVVKEILEACCLSLDDVDQRADKQDITDTAIEVVSELFPGSNATAVNTSAIKKIVIDGSEDEDSASSDIEGLESVIEDKEENCDAIEDDFAIEPTKQFTIVQSLFSTFQQPLLRSDRTSNETNNEPPTSASTTQSSGQRPPLPTKISEQLPPQVDRHWTNESPISFRDEPFLEPKHSASSSDEPVSSLKYKFSNSVKSDKVSNSAKSEAKTKDSGRRKSRAKRGRKFIKNKKSSGSEEVVITDELIAEIASKKGAKVTTEELNEILKFSSPMKTKRQNDEIENVDTQIDDDQLLSVDSEDAETIARPNGEKRGKQWKASTQKNPGFAPSYIRSKFCMDFLDLFRHLVQDNDNDDDTVDEETLNSNGVTWNESVGEYATVAGTTNYDTDGGFDEKQSRITFSFSEAEQMSTDDNSYSTAEESDGKISWQAWRK